MLKELKREPNKLRYVMTKDTNNLYFVYYEKLQGEAPKEKAIYVYPSKTIIKAKDLTLKDLKPLLDFIECKNLDVSEIKNIY